MADRTQSGTSSDSEKRSAAGQSRSGAARGSRGRGAPDGAKDAGSQGDGARQTPEEQIRALYEQSESSTARAFEEFVGKPSFGWVLARSAENVAAMTRIGADVMDLVLRNLRVAGRADITRLARQLHRNEDKLERVLQELEQIRDELGERPDPQRDEQAKR